MSNLQQFNKKILPDKDLVTRVLIKHKASRDNNYLLYHYVLIELNVDPTKISAFDLIKGMKEKTYPAFEGITRSSRKIQEENPELRGSQWHIRKDLEAEFKNKIKKE